MNHTCQHTSQARFPTKFTELWNLLKSFVDGYGEEIKPCVQYLYFFLLLLLYIKANRSISVSIQQCISEWKLNVKSLKPFDYCLYQPT
jgi:hypothetical protein